MAAYFTAAQVCAKGTGPASECGKAAAACTRYEVPLRAGDVCGGVEQLSPRTAKLHAPPGDLWFWRSTVRCLPQGSALRKVELRRPQLYRPMAQHSPVNNNNLIIS